MSSLGIYAFSTRPVPAPLLSPNANANANPNATANVSILFPPARPSILAAVLAAARAPQTQHRHFGTNGVHSSLLSNLEATANRNPTSASAQNAFYQILLKSNLPHIVVERYESGMFATNEVALQAYDRALHMVGQSSSSAAPASPGSAAAAAAAPKTSPAFLQAAAQAAAAHARGANIATSTQAQLAGSSGGPVHVVLDESRSALLLKWVRFFLWYGFVVIVSLMVVSVFIDYLTTFRNTGAAIRNESHLTKAQNQSVRFSDVHGCDEAKEELEELVEFLRNPAKFSTLGGKLPKGVLLMGAPGTGKTLLARAVAGEAGVPFFYMSGSEFDEVYVGVGAKRVRELFAAAKAKSPAIIFIDEIDAIGGKRSPRDQAYGKQTLNQLLTELDGFDQSSGIIIIAATNFPQLLDKALTRPGRFDRHVMVDLPDSRGRVAVLKHHAKKIKMAADVNLESIAAVTGGLSGAELANIVNQAAVRASKLKATIVGMQEFEWAKDKVIMGSEKRSMVMSGHEKELTAYHEAGHAMMMIHNEDVSDKNKLYKVTILPRGGSLGHTAYIPAMDSYSQTADDLQSAIEVCLGGKMAEELKYGETKTTTGSASDLNSATSYAFKMVAECGMSKKIGPVRFSRYDTLSSETKSLIEAEVQRLLSEAYEKVRKVLSGRRHDLDTLAKGLLEYETLDRAEVNKLLRNEKLDRPVIAKGPLIVPPISSPIPPEGSPSPPPPEPVSVSRRVMSERGGD